MLWAATVLSRKRTLAVQLVATSLVPVIFPVGVVVIGLVLAGHDLGTGAGPAAGRSAAVLFVAGAPARMFVTARRAP